MPDLSPWEKYATPATDTVPWDKYGNVSRETPLPGTERTGTPGIPNPPLPSGLQPKKSDAFLNASDPMGGGLESMTAGGMTHFANVPANVRKGNYSGAAADALEGAAGMASPLMIPALASAPLATLTAGAAGYAGSRAGEGIARHFGASPEVQRLAGDVAALPAGAVGGRVGGLVSKLGPPLAESALGIRGTQRDYGATPGKAILDETSSIRPSGVEAEAGGKIHHLNQKLEGMASNTNALISLAPARGVIQRTIGNAQAGNCLPDQIKPFEKMHQQLTEPQPGFAGSINRPMTMMPSPVLGQNGKPMMTPQPGPPEVADMQSPMDFLGMKRRFGKAFTQFVPGGRPSEEQSVANETYGTMARNFNEAVPGGGELNRRIQSLIPVEKRAHIVDLQSGPTERVLDRATRPTGGMVPILAGFHAGGPAGAAATMVGQEVLGSPTAKLIAARTAYGAGKPLVAPGGALVGSQKRKDQ